MLFTRSIYIGIDPSSGPKAIAYAALDESLRPMALGQGSMSEVLAFIGGQQEALVGVHAPARLNQGLMADEERRAGFSPPPTPGRWEDLRLAEYELLRHGLNIYQTPGQEKDVRGWMKTGFTLHQRLIELGYTAYPDERSKRLLAEVSPEVCYQIWLERKPFPKRSLEGRLQRQLALYDLELDIPDPMRFFEEVTRHRILQGELPDDILYSWGELQGLAIAYTAWKAANQPGEVSLLGDLGEGQVLVPVAGLHQSY
jgi:hypothetical protein